MPSKVSQACSNAKMRVTSMFHPRQKRQRSPEFKQMEVSSATPGKNLVKNNKRPEYLEQATSHDKRNTFAMVKPAETKPLPEPEKGDTVHDDINSPYCAGLPQGPGLGEEKQEADLNDTIQHSLEGVTFRFGSRLNPELLHHANQLLTEYATTGKCEAQELSEKSKTVEGRYEYDFSLAQATCTKLSKRYEE